ncbi:MAG: tetratricopeptide repeat protein [Bacteroidia bacterium]|nr:tetratricopeptide repeat protein [Bacteroidia bacterium]
MKNQLTFLLLPLLIWSNIYSQVSNVDSLKQLPEFSRRDSASLKTLFAISASHYLNFEDDSAKKYVEEVINLSYLLGSIEFIGKAYEMKGSFYFNEGKFEEALDFCDSALYYLEKNDNRRRVMTTWHAMALIYLRQGKFEKALEAYNNSYRIAEKLRDSLTMGIVLTGQAGIQKKINEYDLSEDYYHQAISMLQGNDYRSSLRRGMANMNLGNLYIELKKFENALAVEEEAIKIFEEIGHKKFEISVKGNHASTLMEMGRIKEAISPLKERAAYHKEVGPFEYQVALAALGNAYKQLGKFADAESLLLEALSLSRELQAREEESIHLNELSSLYAAKKDFQKAYAYLNEQQSVKDSIFNKNSAEAFQKLTQELETEKKEASILRLELENELKAATIKNDRYIQYGLILGLILLGMAGFFVWLSQRRKLQNERVLARKNEELNKEVFNRKKKDLELRALRSQMNPHFIFNSMNSVNRLILEGKNEQASLNLSKFAKLVRMILEFSEKEAISLKDELELLQAYVRLESRRFKDKITFDIKIDPEVDTEEIEVPSMLLQPFVENAIWHGLMHKENGEGKIFIEIAEKEDFLECVIEDNGVGREKALEIKGESWIEKSSMAMKVTEARLNLLANKHLKQKFIQILDLKNANNQPIGTRVEVSIPI